MAVTLLGRYIDGRLAEHDDKGRPKHTLPALLADPARVVRGDGSARGKYASPPRRTTDL